ncbi:MULTISPECIES: DUF2147 domain-containing protein [Pseudoalteromonas]|jgi:uncharacterized protein (DUF2147 family)|uniref:DUF2147 domain-containing protein n=2 Tax=Pseudoalteromonas TaxID=53246 RepID=A0AAD0RY57_9GAMM|nr:DUF2147 domain-containing protein [Pseudoalteromonas donghaensis]EWH06273.1 hypothetical protein AT00_09860 [Pseudoalteromonas lipolytica SCSIO 04301]MAE02012.1 DUF2147 domain-containing protein [Pseudoalteromonas sp.]MBE0351742.1 hypothetical protein [Pseudoalteromonas lipolytica LMEB 39]QLJ09001.1 DUF2147 domain-containing protein [Pseudoalteromonas sp. JSTW]QMW15232.1 DUF2147 domain-containing protein [Pseudoalteromonas sp. MT33b]QPL43614.1 DUF2147 domain-containing protein [Pseudoalter|tara:strand:- start:1492 stop:1920 length:429 start_codon:yes stop_codon:yes gene_type:complete
MLRLTIALSALLFSQLSVAAMSPVGLWKTIDEETNEAKSLVRIREQNGVLIGEVEKILNPAKQDAICDACKGDKKNKPILGMAIIDGAKEAGDGSWQDGEILDPNNGKTYTLKLTPKEQGKVLEVRGYIAFFYRNQYWQRVE